MHDCAQPPTDQRILKVAIPIPEPGSDERHYEWLAANPVGKVSASGAGIYCLHNTSFWSSFSIEDQVEVRRVGERLEVTALHRRGSYTTFYVAWAESADPEDALATQRTWRDAGAWVENICEHRVVVSVASPLRQRPSWAELILLEQQAPLYQLLVLASPYDRPGDAVLFGHLRAA